MPLRQRCFDETKRVMKGGVPCMCVSHPLSTKEIKGALVCTNVKIKETRPLFHHFCAMGRMMRDLKARQNLGYYPDTLKALFRGGEEGPCRCFHPVMPQESNAQDIPNSMVEKLRAKGYTIAEAKQATRKLQRMNKERVLMDKALDSLKLLAEVRSIEPGTLVATPHNKEMPTPQWEDAVHHALSKLGTWKMTRYLPKSVLMSQLRLELPSPWWEGMDFNEGWEKGADNASELYGRLFAGETPVLLVAQCAPFFLDNGCLLKDYCVATPWARRWHQLLVVRRALSRRLLGGG